MKAKTTIIFLSLLILTLAVSPQAQELIYQDAKQIDYDWPSWPFPGPVVFNGADHTVFYTHQGPDDADRQIYARRLNASGVPIGPQTAIYKGNTDDNPFAAVWDGEAYIVACANGKEQRYLLRVSKDLKLLSTQFLPGKYNWAFGWYKGDIFSLQVVGDRLFFFFSATKTFQNMSQNRTYLAMCDRQLKTNPDVTQLPKGDLRNAGFLGVAIHPNGFLLAMGERGLTVFDNEIKVLRFLEMDFNGEVIRGPFELEEDIVPSISIAGPVFDGKGYFLFFTQREGLQYTNSSMKIELSGKTITGPRDLGDAISQYQWFDPLWAGRHVTCLYFEWARFAMTFTMFDDKGRHVTNPIPYVDVNIGILVGYSYHAFTGRAWTIVFGVQYKNKSTSHVYSNQVSLPPNINKPQVVFFRASEPTVIHPDKRLIMWSCTGSTSVLIKGKGVKLKRLPPVGHRLVDTKGEKLVLKITARGPGGKAKKKLTIKP